MIIPLLALQLAVVVVVCCWVVDCIRTYPAAPEQQAQWVTVLIARAAASGILWWLAGMLPFHGPG